MPHQEGKIPSNHIPGGAGNEKLQKLLTRHMEEQRQRKALMSCREGKAMAEFEEAISQIVGLQDLKMQLRRWARGMLFDEKRRAMGLGIASRRAPHMAFLGNPGTGTTIMFSLIIKSMIYHHGITVIITILCTDEFYWNSTIKKYVCLVNFLHVILALMHAESISPKAWVNKF